MPEDATYEDIYRQVEFMATTMRGMEQAKRGEGLPVEEVARQIPTWLRS